MSDDTTCLERWLLETALRSHERAERYNPAYVRGDGRPRPPVHALHRRLHVRIDVRNPCETSANEGRFEAV